MELTGKDIAKAFGLSERYIHTLFARKKVKMTDPDKRRFLLLIGDMSSKHLYREALYPGDEKRRTFVRLKKQFNGGRNGKDKKEKTG